MAAALDMLVEQLSDVRFHLALSYPVASLDRRAQRMPLPEFPPSLILMFTDSTVMVYDRNGELIPVLWGPYEEVIEGLLSMVEDPEIILADVITLPGERAIWGELARFYPKRKPTTYYELVTP